jgi:hypothetical protein
VSGSAISPGVFTGSAAERGRAAQTRHLPKPSHHREQNIGSYTFSRPSGAGRQDRINDEETHSYRRFDLRIPEDARRRTAARGRRRDEAVG